jgi:hypothetical protein
MPQMLKSTSYPLTKGTNKLRLPIPRHRSNHPLHELPYDSLLTLFRDLNLEFRVDKQINPQVTGTFDCGVEHSFHSESTGLQHFLVVSPRFYRLSSLTGNFFSTSSPIETVEGGSILGPVAALLIFHMFRDRSARFLADHLHLSVTDRLCMLPECPRA